MSKKVTHKLYWDPAPNESDNGGYEGVVCGNYEADTGSHSEDAVTCKRCLKIMYTKEKP